jgi:hypothetical protein
MTGRPNLRGFGAIPDNAEIRGDAVLTYIEGIHLVWLPVCGAVGFEKSIVELGMIR